MKSNFIVQPCKITDTKENCRNVINSSSRRILKGEVALSKELKFVAALKYITSGKIRGNRSA